MRAALRVDASGSEGRCERVSSVGELGEVARKAGEAIHRRGRGRRKTEERSNEERSNERGQKTEGRSAGPSATEE
eukprot:2042611-Pleurochrysis_carterae.AAC.1